MAPTTRCVGLPTLILVLLQMFQDSNSQNPALQFPFLAPDLNIFPYDSASSFPTIAFKSLVCRSYLPPTSTVAAPTTFIFTTAISTISMSATTTEGSKTAAPIIEVRIAAATSTSASTFAIITRTTSVLPKPENTAVPDAIKIPQDLNNNTMLIFFNFGASNWWVPGVVITLLFFAVYALLATIHLHNSKVRNSNTKSKLNHWEDNIANQKVAKILNRKGLLNRKNAPKPKTTDSQDQLVSSSSLPSSLTVQRALVVTPEVNIPSRLRYELDVNSESEEPPLPRYSVVVALDDKKRISLSSAKSLPEKSLPEKSPLEFRMELPEQDDPELQVSNVSDRGAIRLSEYSAQPLLFGHDMTEINLGDDVMSVQPQSKGKAGLRPTPYTPSAQILKVTSESLSPTFWASLEQDLARPGVPLDKKNRISRLLIELEEAMAPTAVSRGMAASSSSASAPTSSFKRTLLDSSKSPNPVRLSLLFKTLQDELSVMNLNSENLKNV